MLSSDSVPMPLTLLIGAQKAGTSIIADCLFKHGGFSRPNVFDGEPHFYNKEVHFFYLDERYCKGANFYRKRFEGSDGLDATQKRYKSPKEFTILTKMQAEIKCTRSR